MRITKRTNIAIRVLMYCATHPAKLVTKSEIAHSCNVSENHLAQVIHQLSQLDYLFTQRGRNGGLRLARSAEQINVGHVFRDIEGALPIVECFRGPGNTCPLISACRLKAALAVASQAFYAHLDTITLGELVWDNGALGDLLGRVDA
ncbi:MAG: Rrf2 family transcriptional regulator [Sedimentitalea sp.]